MTHNAGNKLEQIYQRSTSVNRENKFTSFLCVTIYKCVETNFDVKFTGKLGISVHGEMLCIAAFK